MKKAVIAGSFDPPTLGHENMIQRAAALCDKLYVAVTVNNSKNCMFSLEQRYEMIREICKKTENAEAVMFDGLLAKYVSENEIDCIFRGLRNRTDFDYELELSQIYASYPDMPCETVYLMTDPKFSFISSTVVRENFKLDADISNLVSREVRDLMIGYR